MKLYYWDYRPNFGDRLNVWLWPTLLPGAFEHSDNTVFAGIGSILNERFPAGQKAIIFGSGVGYEQRAIVVQRDWDIRFVRGPVSAAKLGLDRALAICDPAILVKRFYSRSIPNRPFSFMPHWTHATSTLRVLCEDAGFGYVDPANDIEKCITKITTTGVLITESLHGAIVADALGVPWIPISHPRAYTSKWVDYTQSVGLPYHPKVFHALWHSDTSGALGRVKAWAKAKLFLSQLKAATKADAFLSEPHRIEEYCCMIEAHIKVLNEQYAAGGHLLPSERHCVLVAEGSSIAAQGEPRPRV
jgi:succinoglycan biosynthesis protein ExoV